MTSKVQKARLALAEAILREKISGQEAAEELDRHTGPDKRSKSGHRIAGQAPHFDELPKRLRKHFKQKAKKSGATPGTEAFSAAKIRDESPEEARLKREQGLSSKGKRTLKRRRAIRRLMRTKP